MIRITTLLALALLSSAALAGDPSAGQALSTPCQACHGADGNKTLDGQYPRLAGQYADYLAKSLREYRSGTRANLIMQDQSKALTDQQIEDLSAFYAAQKGDLEDLSHLK